MLPCDWLETGFTLAVLAGMAWAVWRMFKER